MKYNGIELTPITTPQIFDTPKEMLVWDENYNAPLIQHVVAITSNNKFRVITVDSIYTYCAAIPEEPKQKRATYLHAQTTKKIMKKSTEYFQNWREKLTSEKIDKLKAQRRAAYLKWQAKISADPVAKENEKIKHRGVALKSFRARKFANREKVNERNREKYLREKNQNSEWYKRKLAYALEYNVQKKALKAGEVFNG